MIQLAYQGKTNEPSNDTKQLKWQATVLEKYMLQNIEISG